MYLTISQFLVNVIMAAGMIGLFIPWWRTKMYESNVFDCTYFGEVLENWINNEPAVNGLKSAILKSLHTLFAGAIYLLMVCGIAFVAGLLWPITLAFIVITYFIYKKKK